MTRPKMIKRLFFAAALLSVGFFCSVAVENLAPAQDLQLPENVRYAPGTVVTPSPSPVQSESPTPLPSPTPHCTAPEAELCGRPDRPELIIYGVCIEFLHRWPEHPDYNGWDKNPIWGSGRERDDDPSELFYAAWTGLYDQEQGYAHYEEYWHSTFDLWNVLLIGSYWNPNDIEPCIENTIVCACMRSREGCFAPGVRIAMADGSDKAVEDIAAGDAVWNPVRRQPSVVRRIIEGPEPLPLLEIGYENSLVRVDRSHPFVTRPGAAPAAARSGSTPLRDYQILPAAKLQPGDLVLGSDNEFHQLTVVRQLPVSEGQRVINLILDTDSELPEDHMVLSEGIVSGDFVLQQQVLKANTD